MNNNDKLPAYCGEGMILDGNCDPILKTRKGWMQYAERKARSMNKGGGKFRLQWHQNVVFIESRNAFRINFASQQFNIQTGR